jgi:hypothetical protein
MERDHNDDYGGLGLSEPTLDACSYALSHRPTFMGPLIREQVGTSMSKKPCSGGCGGRGRS